VTVTADNPGVPSEGGRRVQAVAVAGLIGAAAGAALASHRGRRAPVFGAIAGAAGLSAAEAVARAMQRPGEIPPLWQRIATSAALVAPMGWAAGRFLRVGPVVVGTATGALGGLLGVRPNGGPGCALGICSTGAWSPGRSARQTCR
jgi:hypothetical protein